MDSIVVAGDLRLHTVLGNKRNLLGGALHVKAALKAMGDSSSLDSRPEVLSYESGGDHQLLPHKEKTKTDGQKTWEFRSTTPRSHKKSRQRLVRYTQGGPNESDKNILFPAIPNDFLDGSGSAWCHPHIVVIDDLGLLLQKLNFKSFDISSEEWSNLEAAIIPRSNTLQKKFDQLGLLEKSNQEAEGGNDDEISLCRSEAAALSKSQFDDMHKIILKRLKEAAQRCQNMPEADPAEPIIILSASGYIPEIDGKDKKGVWSFLHEDHELRRRTIVLLDILDLRELVPVNTGLSWERTAQDTIVALENSPVLERLLEFGHVIVRFGITGAMLISKEGLSSPSYTLFFDPEHNDADWTHETKDGTVLGSSSVLIATIIEGLLKNCSTRRGDPSLFDLRRILDDYLPISITRMQKHFCLGYGQTDETLEKFPLEVFKELSTKAEDYSQLLSPAQATHDLLSTAGHQIQSTQVLRSKSEKWSILAGSTQAGGDEIARDIILHGSKTAVNCVRDPLSRFLDHCLHFIAKTIKKVTEKREQLGFKDYVQFLGGKGVDLFGDPLELTKKEETVVVNHIREALNEATIHAARDDQKYLGPQFTKNAAKILKGETDDRISIGRKHSLEEITDGLAHLKNIRGLFKGLSEQQIEGVNGLIGLGTEYIEANFSEHSVSMCDIRIAIKQVFRTLSINRNREPLDELFPSDDDKHKIDEIREALDIILRGRYLFPEFIIKSKIRDVLENQVSQKNIAVPVFRLGGEPSNHGKVLKNQELDKRLVVIDRRVIEGIRAVKRMIEDYLDDTNRDQPLSIAVFGSPGSGKSLAVKKIIEELKEGGRIAEKIDCNLSELTSSKDLKKTFDEIRKLQNLKKIPIVFFDEFDSEYKSTPLGWLRFFLAAMEDSTYLGEKLPLPIVFVFAGGTSSTFEEFSLAGRSESDDRWSDYRKAKGPDFVSRLRGHLNVIGVNPVDGSDESFLVRRAIVIRALLAMRQNLKDGVAAKIDDEMVHAFLHVPRYKHGARSISKMLKMCTGRDSKISMSAVPPIAQLNMHVDNGQAFVKLVAEASYLQYDAE